MRAFFAASILVPPDGSASFIDPEESSISRTLGAGSSACAAGRTGPHTDTSSKAPQAAARRWDRFIGLPPIFATANLRFAVANVKPWADTLRPTVTNPDPTIRPDHHPHPRGELLAASPLRNAHTGCTSPTDFSTAQNVFPGHLGQANQASFTREGQ